MLARETFNFHMRSDHPFQTLFETFGKLPETHSDEVNREARETMKSWLKVPLENSGHCILLKAPRAGHGKTHLLTRLQYELGGSHEFIPLHAIGGSRIDAATVLDDTLRRLVRGLPAAGGLTVLDLVARRLFSASLQPLVNSGEVPCQDREGAINALRSRPIETFDFHHPGAVTAHWARDNFELLGPRLSLELSQVCGLSLREVSFWVDAMFRFSATPIDNPGRVRALAATVFEDPGAEAVAHERLVALLGLLTSLMRVVLVADEIEGFSSDETAALRFASFLGALRQSAERVDVVLSLNEDVWKSAFLPRLSGGLADRLSEVVVELEPLNRAGMIAIIESRSPGAGEKIVSEMEPDTIHTHARGIIKEAGIAWDDAVQGKPRRTLGQPKQETPATGHKLEEVQPSAAIEPLPEPAPPEPREPGKPVVDPFSGFAPATPAPFPGKAPEEPATELSAPATAETPPHVEIPVKNSFSAEAAIAAFAAAPAWESAPSMFSQGAAPLNEESRPVAEEQPTPPSWPSPEVPESAFQAPGEAAPTAFFAAPPGKKEEPVSIFSAAPPGPEEEPASAFSAPPAPAPQEPPASIFQAAPAEPSSMFGAPPAPGQGMESASVFAAAPPVPPEEPVSAIQAPPEPPAQQPERTSMFQAAPAPAEEAVSAFQAPPAEEAPSAFQAAPAQQEQAPVFKALQNEAPVSAFEAPPEPPAFSAAPPAENAASAFQAPPAPAAVEKSDDASTDRVDDLLRQFRERYGKS